jgi:hypothetical protein
VARSRAASQETRRTTSHGGVPTARPVPGVKTLLFGLVLASLVGFFAVALTRELTTGSRAPARTESARPAVATPRPALSAAEEAYAQALWPIHNDVKLGALRMTMSGIQYKTNNIDAATLKATVDASMEIYRRAEVELGALRPPPSLQDAHDEYLGAVRLYQQSAAEMVKLYEDNRDDHLVAAFPMSQEGGQRLRRVGALLWPSEYVPN